MPRQRLANAATDLHGQLINERLREPDHILVTTMRRQKLAQQHSANHTTTTFAETAFGLPISGFHSIAPRTASTVTMK